MSIDLTSKAQETLVRIYIGQNIRKEGILQSEVPNVEEAEILLSKALIAKNHWYLDQYLTTAMGATIASKIVNEKIEANQKDFFEKSKTIPNRVLNFFVKRYVSRDLAFSANKSDFDTEARFFGSWTAAILMDERIWMLWNDFFESLMASGFCVKTRNYVSTRGGEKRAFKYVISPEVQSFLVDKFSGYDFSLEEEKALNLYPFLTIAKRIMAINDVNEVRSQYYQLLKRYELTQDQVAGIVGEMSKHKITTEYRDLLSEWKPFDILNPIAYEIYLTQNITEPAAKFLLKDKGKITIYPTEEKFPTLSELKAELGFLDDNQLGEFYLMVSSFERHLREFMKEKLGESWEKRIKNDARAIYERWNNKKDKDIRWGIDPEKELVSYSDLGDYIAIIKQYPKIFTDKEDMGDIIANLKIWYNQGRNPLMHSRTVDKQKYYTTKSAIDFLSGWMTRKNFPVS